MAEPPQVCALQFSNYLPWPVAPGLSNRSPKISSC
jgi:hypothetical protein